MAYGKQYSGSANKAAASTGTASKAVAGKVENILRTGLFTPTGEKVIEGLMGSVQLKEAVTLPAGTWINLYENDKARSKNPEKAPDFNLQFRPGVVKAAK